MNVLEKLLIGETVSGSDEQGSYEIRLGENETVEIIACAGKQETPDRPESRAIFETPNPLGTLT